MKYEKPISEIKEFECYDVVTTSGDSSSLDNGNEFTGGGEYGF